MTTRITFGDSDGTSGELALPAGSGKSGGVLLFHEWWGIVDHIRSLLDRLAAAGFVALCPDLYHGKTTKDADEAGKMMGALDWSNAMRDIASAATALRQHERCNGKVGVIGFCMGGALALGTATKLRDLSAVVAFYGVPGPEYSDWSKVTAPVLAHFARRDQWAKPELAEAIQLEITKHGGKMDLHLYDSDHAFANDTRPEVHDPEATKLAWHRSMDFLHAHLD
jgi:carboxymethylenebutenolidase